MISFATTHKELDTIVKIAERAEKLAIGHNIGRPDRKTLLMDLSATHANGCPLRLDDLLNFPDFDFVHDVWGIMRHIDRETGKLTNCFMPRCSA